MNQPAVKTEVILISKILRDPTLNSRKNGVDKTVADQYAEQIANGAKFPPVVIYSDGKVWRLVDGFHRCTAHELAGKTELECVVHKGDERAARLYSVGCNTTHGLPRTTADKRHAVTLLLSDAEWRTKSDRWIADTCGVGHPFVAKLRGQVESDSTTTREGRDGKQQSAKKKPKKGRKSFDAVRAAKEAPKALAALVKRWPKDEPIAPLVEAVAAWIAERSAGSKVA